MTNSIVTQNELNPFQWKELTLTESVMIHAEPYFTRRAIGEWLEYEHPQQAIAKILDRNIYIENYSVVVNMGTTDGKNYDTQVFHPVGFLLIVMESSQPKAIQMKELVARFVYEMGFSDNPYKNLTPYERMALSKQRVTIHRNIEESRTIMRQEAMIDELRFICGAIGADMPDLSNIRTPLGQIPMLLEGQQ